ncbi:MAG: LysM peptidoglycan-binding domain-containing protein [Muribaculaceae bacterium]|nr:LysM peptidoglycan-binding domain-containing protein [Muribaculaceae bacterium]
MKGSPLSAKSTYIVRQGDTVRKIASRAGISTLRLCQLNFITEDQPLEPGTMLKLK